MKSRAEPRPPSTIEHLLRPTRPRLKAAFAPRSFAVIGASESLGSVGRTLMANLATFQGRVYPVNPHRQTVLGLKALPNIGAAPAGVDLVVIATPDPIERGRIQRVAPGIPQRSIAPAIGRNLGVAVEFTAQDAVLDVVYPRAIIAELTDRSRLRRTRCGRRICGSGCEPRRFDRLR